MTKPSAARIERRKPAPTKPTPPPQQQGIDQAMAERIQALVAGKVSAPTEPARELVKRLQEARALYTDTENSLTQARANVTALERQCQGLDGRMGGFIDLLRAELDKVSAA